MSPTDQNAALAQIHGITPSWVLMKRGYYYRPNAHGYTSELTEAGRYTEEEAKRHVNPHDEPVTMHPLPPMDYLRDLNALAAVEDSIPLDRLGTYLDNLRLVCSAGLPEGCYVMDIECARAKPAQRAKALLITYAFWAGPLP